MHEEEQYQEEKLFIDLGRLINALKQQMLNPEILVFESQSYQPLHTAIKEQQSRIKQYLQFDPDQNDIPGKNLKQRIYRSETEKISYVLKQYIRLRLQKIEKYAFYLIKNQNFAEKRLSQNQFHYMKSYAQLRYRYFQENILKNLFKPYRGLGGLEVYFSKMNELKLQVDSKQSKVDIVGPDFSQYCFVHIASNPDLSLRFNHDMKAQNIEGQSIIPSGSIVYTQYKNAKNLIADSNAQLI